MIPLILPVFLFFIAACSSRPTHSSPPTEEESLPPPPPEPSVIIKKSKEIENPTPERAVAVGRALESGELATARKLAAHLGESPPELLVKARLAEATGDEEAAVRLYHRLTDAVPDFEPIRIEALADALHRAGRTEEAAELLESFLKTDKTENEKPAYRLRMRIVDLWKEADRPDRALPVLAKLIETVPDADHRDRARVAEAEIRLMLEEREAAAKILKDVVTNRASKTAVLAALKVLQKGNIQPALSDTERLDLAEALIGYRKYNEASVQLDAVKGSLQQKEVDWLRARLLFKQRGHYKEAVAALDAVIKGKGPRADDAKFLRARALSRLDRDAEAVRAYRAYAAQTSRKQKAAEARYLAGRLEFYLGRHKQAASAMEGLVGTGRKKTASALNGSDTRQAHFLAGLCLLLSNRPTQAGPHFSAASNGTNDTEVLNRNAYWLAVAEYQTHPKKGRQALHAVCAKDPTDWYARMAALRLADAGAPLGPCALDRHEAGAPNDTETAAGAPNSGQPKQTKAAAILDAVGEPLRTVDALAGLYADAGLFRNASDRLRTLEKKGTVKKWSPEQWLALYTALDAPQYAISKAAAQFHWPPTPENSHWAEAAYPLAYTDLMKRTEAEHALPDMLLVAIARKESLFDPGAVSRVGAMGLMQMMPQTYEANRKRAGLPPLKPGALPGPEASIRAAGYEFQALFKKFSNLPLAVMAYNGGAAAVSRWLDRSAGYPLDVFVEKAGFTETRNYVRRVTKNLVRYRALYGGDDVALPRMIEKTAK